jgi:hypothetical protein
MDANPRLREPNQPNELTLAALSSSSESLARGEWRMEVLTTGRQSRTTFPLHLPTYFSVYHLTFTPNQARTPARTHARTYACTSTPSLVRCRSSPVPRPPTGPPGWFSLTEARTLTLTASPTFCCSCPFTSSIDLSACLPTPATATATTSATVPLFLTGWLVTYLPYVGLACFDFSSLTSTLSHQHP